MLMHKEFSGSPKTALDFIERDKDIILAGELRESLDVVRGVENCAPAYICFHHEPAYIFFEVNAL